MHVRGAPVDLVVEQLEVGGHSLSLLRPRDAEALLDEEAFEHEEFLPYWAELWPSAVALAHAVAGRPLAGTRVVELGCGLALPSIVAALAGARVLASDWSEDALGFARLNAERNGATIETLLCSWSRPEALLEQPRFDLVLASDVLYERRDVAPLLELLPGLVHDGGEVLLAEPGRPAAGGFLETAAAEWEIERLLGLATQEVPLYGLRKREAGT